MRLEYDEDNGWFLRKEIPYDPMVLERMFSHLIKVETKEERLKRWRMEDKKDKVLARVMKIIETLTPKQREALQLYYLKEKTYRQMGKIMGISFQRCSRLVSDGIRNVQKACAKAGIGF